MEVNVKADRTDDWRDRHLSDPRQMKTVIASIIPDDGCSVVLADGPDGEVWVDLNPIRFDDGESDLHWESNCPEWVDVLVIHAHFFPDVGKTTERVISHRITDFHLNKIITGDCRVVMDELPANSIHLVVTSPPYFGCRKYGDETLGREADPREYVHNIVTVTDSIMRVLRPDGSFFLNVGDVYFGTKGFHRNKGKYCRHTQDHYAEHRIVASDGKYLQHKQLLLLPPRIAMAMQERGWILRNVIIWEKTNPQPSPARDRRLPCYEYIFHIVKSGRYYFDQPLCRALGHHRDVIRTSVSAFDGHPASFSERLMEPFILTSSRPGDIVLDPFSGSGCIAALAKKLGRNFIGIELNEAYARDSRDRIDRVEPGEGYGTLGEEIDHAA